MKWKGNEHLTLQSDEKSFRVNNTTILKRDTNGWKMTTEFADIIGASPVLHLSLAR